jgi:O-succinylbenzoate-CoA ligase
MKTSIGYLLKKRAFMTPQKEAFVGVGSGTRLDYAQFNRHANRAASALKGLGVKHGDRVALLLGNTVEYLELFFGIAKLGAVCVPLNVRLTADELAFILKDSGARTLVYGDAWRTIAADLHARGAAATAVQHWVHHGQEADTFASRLGALLAAASDAEPELAGFDDDALFIMYTSGTTGLPKGAVHTHHTVLWAVMSMAATWDVRQSDRFLIGLPLFHVGALSPAVMAVYAGMTSVVPAGFDPSGFWKTLEAERVTNSLLVPTQLTLMLQAPEKATCQHPDLRWVAVAGAPVPVLLLEAYLPLGVSLQQLFGLTEACGPGCALIGDDVARKPGSAGKAFLHNECRVVDANGKDVAPGERGELLIQGQHVMREYWNRPDATASTLRDGWLHTGDVATVDGEGFIFIVDRIKDMIISGGENIYPAEIEVVIAGLPGVTGVAVIGRADDTWGEVPVAMIEGGAGLDEAMVIEHCAGKLARYKIPKAVQFVATLPRTSTGKVKKTELRTALPG